VFEFVDHTVLDDLERYPNGLDEMRVKKIMWQVVRALEFCHNHNVSTLQITYNADTLNVVKCLIISNASLFLFLGNS
jgi:serine/threonine protein kinase